MAKAQQDITVLFIKYLNPIVFMSILKAQNSDMLTEKKHTHTHNVKSVSRVYSVFY